jgi:hypothetical protein
MRKKNGEGRLASFTKRKQTIFVLFCSAKHRQNRALFLKAYKKNFVVE